MDVRKLAARLRTLGRKHDVAGLIRHGHGDPPAVQHAAQVLVVGLAVLEAQLDVEVEQLRIADLDEGLGLGDLLADVLKLARLEGPIAGYQVGALALGDALQHQTGDRSLPAAGRPLYVPGEAVHTLDEVVVLPLNRDGQLRVFAAMLAVERSL
jgi:hypothetical protein